MRIYCVEQNYMTHKREKENHVDKDLLLFQKPENALYPTGETYTFTNFDECKLFCQAELILKISKGGKSISREQASSHLESMTTGINFTSINIHDELNGIVVPWEEVKAWPGSSLIGIWSPASEFRNLSDLNFCLYKNREMVQLGNSELMIHDIYDIIAEVSKQFELEEGDLIFTGTPSGIGEVFEGDKLEAFTEDDSVLEFEIGGK
ncbi:MAG: fumarylacetoacetate hydrolase family protein [Ginsengibacter sp.]